MSLETRRPDHPLEPALYFTSFDLEGVFPHEDDPVVIFVVTIGQKVHRVLVNQGRLAFVMFWGTFTNMQLSPDQLRPYNGCLVGFAGDRVEVQGYIELRTTFSDENAAMTITSKYIVVNASFAYNLLLGRPSLNRLGAVASIVHMKMKLPSTEGGVITIKVDQKTARKCYESSLKNRGGTYTIAIQAGDAEWIAEADVLNKRRLELAGEVQERDIKGKKFKLGTSLCKELEDKIADVISENMNAFARSSADMLGIDRDFLCHQVNMDERVKPMVQRRRKFNEDKHLIIREELISF